MRPQGGGRQRPVTPRRVVTGRGLPPKVSWQRWPSANNPQTSPTPTGSRLDLGGPSGGDAPQRGSQTPLEAIAPPGVALAGLRRGERRAIEGRSQARNVKSMPGGVAVERGTSHRPRRAPKTARPSNGRASSEARAKGPLTQQAQGPPQEGHLAGQGTQVRTSHQSEDPNERASRRNGPGGSLQGGRPAGQGTQIRPVQTL